MLVRIAVSRIAVVVALIALGACPPPPAPAPTTPEPAPPVARPAAPPPVLDVVFEDNWQGLTRIMGVDERAGVVYLWRTATEPHRSVVDAVDLDAGRRVDRFEAAGTMGRYLWETTGAFATEAAVLVRVLARTMPRHTRNEPVASPIAVSPDGQRFVYPGRPTDGKDGDWLFLGTADGARAGRLDRGLRASYTPVFSPDSRRVAWRGYSARHRGYRLWLSEIGGRPRFVRGTEGARLPVFSADGHHVYTLTRVKVRTERHPGFGGVRDVFRQCLTRVRAVGEGAPESLACVESYHDAHFVQAASGNTGVFVVQRGESGEHAFEYKWLKLPTGEVIATHRVDRPFQAGVLGERGVLVTEAARGLIAVSLRDGRVATLIARGKSDQFRLDGTAFFADGSLVALRGNKQRWSVVVTRPAQALK